MKLKRKTLFDKFKDWFIEKYVPEKKLYHDLLYCVRSYNKNETKHETAKRYIKNAEIGMDLKEALRRK